MRTVLFIFLLYLQSAGALAAPRVVTSIAPLQEITASIMAGIARPESIISGHASAHHFAFRPSHMRSLQQADLVIWIDRHFEAGFQRVSQTLPEATSQLEILAALDIEGEDGHIWYSPRLLRLTIDMITERLTQLDPKHREHYRDNAAQLNAEVTDWHAETEAWLQDHRPGFITDHAFTYHFETDFGYPALATIHDQHDGHSGLQELNRIEEILQQDSAGCLLTLEPTPAPLALELARKYHLKVLYLTPPDGSEASIISRLQILLEALKACN